MIQVAKRGIASFFTVMTFATLVAGWETLVIIAPVFSYLLVTLVSALAIAMTAYCGFILHHRVRLMDIDRSELKAKLDWLNTRRLWALEAIDRGQLPSEVNEMGFKMSAPNTQMKMLPEPSSVPDAPKRDLLQALAPFHTLLFVGGRRRGKTTNMMRIMEQRSGQEKAVVFDTHSSPSKWPTAVEVIGSEVGITETERFENMWEKMQALVAIKNDRLDRFRRGEVGEGQFNPNITIYIDEFTHIPVQLKEVGHNIKDFSSRILTEGAKVNFHFVWGVHSFRKNALGLEGSMDLTECFDAVVHLIREQSQYYAKVSWTGDERDDGHMYEPAPPYPPGIITSSGPRFKETVIIDMAEESIELEPEPNSSPEIDSETGWPSIEEGTVRERLQAFSDYLNQVGVTCSNLPPVEVLNFLKISRNGRNYDHWSTVCAAAEATEMPKGVSDASQS